MAKSDQWVNIILVTMIVMYLSVLFYGYRMNKVSTFISYLNMVVGIVLIAYWATKGVREGRETMVVAAELLSVCFAIYAVTTGNRYTWLKISQYLFFALHLIVAILGLVFMLTFKMNKLI